jgi:F1F0 ATPase subunit 2
MARAMTDILMLAFMLAYGIALGIIYFGGLWLTLQRLTSARHPAILALGSFSVRSGACLFGFYLVSENGIDGIAYCLTGFIMVKVILIHKWGLNANTDMDSVVD